MDVVLSRQAVKAMERIQEPVKGRLTAALRKLREDPPQGDIKAMTGQDGFRLRVGGIRVLFGIIDNTIVVTNILPRGQVYKRRR